MVSRLARGIAAAAILWMALTAVGVAALATRPRLASDDAPQPRFTISGRVDDPHNLRPADAMLSLGFERDGVAYGVPVPMTRTGDFATHALGPGVYVLAVIRTPHSKGAPSTTVGLTITRIEDADVAGLRVTIQRDTALEGRFRMAPGISWPAQIAVTTCLEFEGARLANCFAAEGGPGGKFILRNAYGPRLLHVTYSGLQTPRPRILLDGRDITRVPTDFSAHLRAHPAATLEVVFEPAR